MTARKNRDRLTIDIGGFIVSIETKDGSIRKRISERYQEFLCTDNTPQLTIFVNVQPNALYIEPVPGPWVIDVDYKDNRLTYQSYLERGEVDFVSGLGHLDMAPEANIENFLRAIFAWLCLTNGGLLLHAAGVIRNGLGYVFFGPSGAGKTTTSRLAARSADIVSDDLVIIRLNNGSGTLHGVPFRGQLSEAPRANQSAPLKAMFRLRQDTAHFVEPLSHIKAVADLVASSPFVVSDLSLANRLVEVCDVMAKTLPVMQLHFKRDDGFWKVIDEHFEKVPKTASANSGTGY